MAARLVRTGDRGLVEGTVTAIFFPVPGRCGVTPPRGKTYGRKRRGETPGTSAFGSIDACLSLSFEACLEKNTAGVGGLHLLSNLLRAGGRNRVTLGVMVGVWAMSVPVTACASPPTTALHAAQAEAAPASGGAAVQADIDAASVGTEADHVSVPRRLVSLVPSITETLFALGIGDRVVGVSTSCDFPTSVQSLPKVGTFTAPVAEAIVALAPDLVLTSPSPGNQSVVAALQRAGVRVAVVHADGGMEEARQGMLAVAEAVGEGARGRDLVAGVDAELEMVRSAVAGLERPKVAVAVGREPLILAGPSSYLGELVILAGGDNVADAVGGRWPQVGMEYLVQQQPQVIFDLSVPMERPAVSGDSSGPDVAGTSAFQAWAGLSTLPAVAERRVYDGSDGSNPGGRDGEPDSLLLRPGPRLGRAARLLAARLHPGQPGLENPK